MERTTIEKIRKIPTAELEEIKVGIKEAARFRDMAWTYRSSVGTAVETIDGTWSGGFNIEYSKYGGLHAEEMSFIRKLDEGNRRTDFKRLTEVFQDAGHNDVEIFPACALHCWGIMYAFAHPEYQIIVADTNENIRYVANLNEILHPPGEGLVYPSEKIRAIKPLSNFTPRGDGPPLQTKFKMKHSEDVKSLIDVLFEYKNRRITFDPLPPQLVFDSVAYGMGNKEVFGGFYIQTYNHKGYKPEETGGMLAAAKGNKRSDFKIMGALVPANVKLEEVRPFLAGMFDTWGTVTEFAPNNIRLVAVNQEREIVYDGTIYELYTQTQNNPFIDELRRVRRRKGSD